jgi:hypothetical protein
MNDLWRQSLPSRGKPVEIVGGRRTVYIATDMGEWLSVNDRLEVEALPPRGGYAAAATTADGRLLVAPFEPSIAVAVRDGWENVHRSAPVLSIARHGQSLVMGDTAGEITAIDSASDTPRSIARMQYAVTDVLSDGDTIAFLDGRCGILPAASEPLFADTALLGGPALALFRANERNRIGVSGATQVGLIDATTAGFVCVSDQIPDAIRQVIALPKEGGGYAVITDGGQLVLLDAALQRTQIALPRDAEEVIGGTAIDDSLLIWTTTGQLYRINRRRAVVAEPRDEVVVVSAFGLGALVVRWNERDGGRLEIMHLGDGA